MPQVTDSLIMNSFIKLLELCGEGEDGGVL
jgi:hypothetical protein